MMTTQVSQATTSPWYDQLMESDIDTLRSEINTAICHGDRYEAWQIGTLRQLAITNGLHQSVIDNLTRCRDLRNEQDRRRKAAESVNTKAKLQKRLREAAGLLVREYHVHFQPIGECRLDVEHQRLWSKDGKYFLQWKNEATTAGQVGCYEYTG